MIVRVNKWCVSSYFFHPVAMVEDLIFQQDARNSIVIPNDPLGLWCGEDPRMLHVKGVSLHCMILSDQDICLG